MQHCNLLTITAQQSPDSNNVNAIMNNAYLPLTMWNVNQKLPASALMIFDAYIVLKMFVNQYY